MAYMEQSIRISLSLAPPNLRDDPARDGAEVCERCAIQSFRAGTSSTYSWPAARSSRSTCDMKLA